MGGIGLLKETSYDESPDILVFPAYLAEMRPSSMTE
jgi:hypothetical protein